MALFINRWSRPCHVFVAERGEAVDLHDEPARYELSGASHTPALCGMDLDAANSQGQMYHDVPHVLLVTRLARWSDLEAFATSDDLCEDCREALPNEWPPAAEYVETEPESESESEGLGELFG